MNSAHLHLLINHVPVLATLFSLAVLAWGLYFKSEAVKRVALAGFLLAGLSVFVATQSGDSAEEIVEEIPAVTHDAIHEHEEAAELAQWLTVLLALGALGGFYMLSKQKKGQTAYFWVLLLFGVLTSVSLSYTAYRGGLIRHPEIENADAAAAGDAQAAPDEASDEEGQEEQE